MGWGVTGLLQGIGGGGSDADIYGRRAVVPELGDYSANLQKTVKENTALLPSLSELASGSTALYAKLREQSMPGITAAQDQAMKNTLEWSQGVRSKAEEDYVTQKYAELSRSQGTSGSQFSIFGNINQNVNDIQARKRYGTETALRWLQQAQSQTFDFTKFFRTKEDSAHELETRFSRDWLAEQVAASPDPAVRGAFDTEMGFIGEVLSAYGGGAGYQGYYKGGAGGGGGAGGSNADYMSGNSSFFNSQERQTNSMQPMNSWGGGAASQGSDGWYHG